MRVLIVALLALAAAHPPLRPQDAAPVAAVAQSAALPHLAVDPDGGAYVAFLRDGNVELAVSTDFGKTFAPPVVAIDALKKAAAPSGQRGPRVAVDKQRRVYVSAFLPLDPKNPAAHDLYLAVSADRGKTFSKPARINDPPGTAGESLHWTAVSPGGELLLAWLDGRRGKGQDLYTAKTSDQAKKTPKNALLVSQVCERCAPAVAIDAKGAPVFAYREGGDRKSRQVQFLPNTTSRPVQVNTADTRLARCPQDAPAVAVGADGKTAAVAWMDTREGESDSNVYWTARKDGKFPPESRASDVGNYYQGRPTVAVDGLGIAWFAWEDGRHGVQRVYVANAANRVNVSLTGEKDPKGEAPSLAAQGGFVGVAYRLGENVVFRVLAAP